MYKMKYFEEIKPFLDKDGRTKCITLWSWMKKHCGRNCRLLSEKETEAPLFEFEKSQKEYYLPWEWIEKGER